MKTFDDGFIIILRRNKECNQKNGAVQQKFGRKIKLQYQL